MDTPCYDVMVDIETTGTAPDHSAVIQIAAVRFDLQSQTIDSTDMFNRCLAIPPKRFWDESTREWWGKQKRDILMGIYSRMEDPREVLSDFSEWARKPGQERPLTFWGKPTHFDFSFMQSYFTQFDVYNPFHFRYARDMNSFISGLARTSEHQNVEVDFAGDAHNAIYDVINQIAVLFKAMDEVGR